MSSYVPIKLDNLTKWQDFKHISEHTYQNTDIPIKFLYMLPKLFFIDSMGTLWKPLNHWNKQQEQIIRPVAILEAYSCSKLTDKMYNHRSKLVTITKIRQIKISEITNLPETKTSSVSGGTIGPL